MTDIQLPKARVLYYPNYIHIMGQDFASKIFNDIGTLFNNEIKRTVQKQYTLNRKTMVFVDSQLDRTVIPHIWGDEVTVHEFTPDLLKLKELIETTSGFAFNICLANYYKSGKEAIGFHADNEEKGSTSCIASISLGAERNFVFRRNRQLHNFLAVYLLPTMLMFYLLFVLYYIFLHPYAIVSILQFHCWLSCCFLYRQWIRYENSAIVRKLILSHGSLLIMGKGTQENYEHSLPGDKLCKQPRLNLTFRLFDAERYHKH